MHGEDALLEIILYLAAALLTVPVARKIGAATLSLLVDLLSDRLDVVFGGLVGMVAPRAAEPSGGLASGRGHAEWPVQECFVLAPHQCSNLGGNGMRSP